MKKKQLATTALVILLPLLVFEGLARLEWIDSFTFIPLTEMIASAWQLMTDPAFIKGHFLVTVVNILIAFAASAVVGIAVGVLLWKYDQLYFSLQPYIMLSYAVPMFAVYPVFILLFGMGRPSILVLGFLLAAPAIIMNTAIGFRETKKVFLKVGRTFQLSFRQMLFSIYFPAAWPHIFTGLKLGFIYSMIGVISPEFILSPNGIGYSIKRAFNDFDLHTMYGGIVLVVAFALLTNLLLKAVESRLYKKEIKGT